MTLDIEKNGDGDHNGHGSPQKLLKIFIHTMDGCGHINASIGIGQALAKRGHRVIGLLNIAFAGQFTIYGLEEILLTRNPKVSKTPVPENPVKGFAEQLLKSGFLSGIPPLEKIKLASIENNEDNFIQTLFDSTLDFNSQINDAIEREQPDLFILDHFLIPPCIQKQQHRMPWIFLYSGNPLALYDNNNLPPFGSGLNFFMLVSVLFPFML